VNNEPPPPPVASVPHVNTPAPSVSIVSQLTSPDKVMVPDEVNPVAPETTPAVDMSRLVESSANVLLPLPIVTAPVLVPVATLTAKFELMLRSIVAPVTDKPAWPIILLLNVLAPPKVWLLAVTTPATVADASDTAKVMSSGVEPVLSDQVMPATEPVAVTSRKLASVATTELTVIASPPPPPPSVPQLSTPDPSVSIVSQFNNPDKVIVPELVNPVAQLMTPPLDMSTAVEFRTKVLPAEPRLSPDVLVVPMDIAPVVPVAVPVSIVMLPELLVTPSASPVVMDTVSELLLAELVSDDATLAALKA
jgi:hypothetical protein